MNDTAGPVRRARIDRYRWLASSHEEEPAPLRGRLLSLRLIGMTQLWTTLDVSPPHTTPFASVSWLTFARNLPLLGGM